MDLKIQYKFTSLLTHLNKGMVNVAILGWLPEASKYTDVCRLVKPGSHLRSLFPCQEWN